MNKQFQKEGLCCLLYCCYQEKGQLSTVNHVPMKWGELDSTLFSGCAVFLHFCGFTHFLLQQEDASSPRD